VQVAPIALLDQRGELGGHRGRLARLLAETLQVGAVLLGDQLFEHLGDAGPDALQRLQLAGAVEGVEVGVVPQQHGGHLAEGPGPVRVLLVPQV